MSHIIAVAAPIGGGKTSLATALASQLEDAALLFYDHYERATQRPVDHLFQWLEDGADFSAFRIPGLANDLKSLKQGRAIIDPSSRMEIRARKYVVFEMPLGRAHAESAPFIDLLLWIDVPLDIALARKIREFTVGLLNKNQPVTYRNGLLWIDRYVESYIGTVHKILAAQKKTVRKDADIIIDGQQAVATMAEDAAAEIRRRIEESPPQATPNLTGKEFL